MAHVLCWPLRSFCSHVSFFMFFFVFLKMFLVGLATVVRLCFTSDTVLLIDWLYCIDLFSCIAASVFNKLTYLLTYTSSAGVCTYSTDISMFCQ